MAEENNDGMMQKFALPVAIIVAALVLSTSVFMAADNVTAELKTLEAKINGTTVVPTVTPTATVTATPTPVVNISISGRPIEGNASAKVTIVAFSDFQCPYCSSAHTTMKQILGNYSGKVRYVHFNFPLSFHQYAEKAAEAFECAAAQDSVKAYKLHDMMYENQAAIDVTNLKQYAVTVGLNATAFNTCLDSGATASSIATQQNYGSSLGVSGTPSFFINGKLLVGAQPYATFKQAVDQALAAAG